MTCRQKGILNALRTRMAISKPLTIKVFVHYYDRYFLSFSNVFSLSVCSSVCKRVFIFNLVLDIGFEPYLVSILDTSELTDNLTKWWRMMQTSGYSSFPFKRNSQSYTPIHFMLQKTKLGCFFYIAILCFIFGITGCLYCQNVRKGSKAHLCERFSFPVICRVPSIPSRTV